MSAARSGSVQRVYFALAAFNVGTLLISLWLAQQLMEVYQGSVEQNGAWAGRIALYADLRRLVTQANAPGNDVFVDGDVPGQRQRLDAVEAEADAAFARVEADLGSLPLSDRGPLRPHLDGARANTREMVREARDLFAAYAAGRKDEAGHHMAQMDQAFARASADLDALRAQVQLIQAGLFRAQLAEAGQAQRSQYALMALALVLVAAAVTYGFRLQRTFARQQALVDRANAGMRLVLDNVDQGLLTVDVAGRVEDERSAAVQAWLGPVEAGVPLWTTLAREDHKAAAWLEVGWGNVVEDLLPLEVSLDQLPRRLHARGRELELGYRPITEGGRLVRVLVVLTDVTARVQAEQLERQQRETLAMFERVMRDRAGFVEAFEECGRLVAALGQVGDRDLVVVRRQLHTLKGTAAALGLEALAATCHALEDDLHESRGDLTRAQAQRLEATWAALEGRLQVLLGQRQDRAVVMEAREYQAILAAVSQDQVPRDAVREMVQALEREPLAPRLERLAEQARAVATRLGKGPLDVTVETHGLRVEAARYRGLLGALVHVVRNAVDHGLEAPAARQAQGKGAPSLRLSAALDGEALVLELADDGQGIDFDALLARARARGLSPRDGLEALFADGVSTKDSVSDLSGRGVGLGAVRAAAEALGGRVEVASTRGVGTTFRVVVPAQGVSAALASSSRPRLALVREAC